MWVPLRSMAKHVFLFYLLHWYVSITMANYARNEQMVQWENSSNNNKTIQVYGYGNFKWLHSKIFSLYPTHVAFEFVLKTINIKITYPASCSQRRGAKPLRSRRYTESAVYSFLNIEYVCSHKRRHESCLWTSINISNEDRRKRRVHFKEREKNRNQTNNNRPFVYPLHEYPFACIILCCALCLRVCVRKH